MTAICGQERGRGQITGSRASWGAEGTALCEPLTSDKGFSGPPVTLFLLLHTHGSLDSGSPSRLSFPLTLIALSPK